MITTEPVHKKQTGKKAAGKAKCKKVSLYVGTDKCTALEKLHDLTVEKLTPVANQKSTP